METASQVHENCQTIDCTSQNQNTTGEKLEISSEHVLSESMETITTDAVAQNYRTIDSSTLEQNTPEEKRGTGFEHVSGVPMDIRKLGSDAEEKCHLTGNSITNVNRLGKHEPKLVLAGPIETTTAGSNARNCIQIDSCRDELHSEHGHVELMKTRIAGSDSVDGRLSGVKTMITTSVAQSCQTLESSTQEQNTPDEKLEICSDHVSSVTVDIGILESAAEEKSHITGNSISLGGKHAFDSNFIPSEPLETSASKSNLQSRSVDSCHDEHYLQGEALEIAVEDFVSVDVGISGTETKIIATVAQNCQTSGTSTLEQNAPEESHEMGSVGISSKTELDPKHVLSEPIETKTAGSSAENCRASDSCYEEPGCDCVQDEPMEARIPGSDSTALGLAGTETTGSVAQSCRTLEYSFQEPNAPDEMHEVGSEQVSSKPMDSRILQPDAEEECHITGNSISLAGKHDSKLVLGETIETRTAESNNAQNIQTNDLCLNKASSEHAQVVPVETKIVGSNSVDVGLSATLHMCTTENSNGPGNHEGTVSSRSKKRKSVLRDPPGTPRVLRPRLNGLCKPPDPISAPASVSCESDKKRKKRKRTNQELDNEFSRARKRLKYLLSRMGYEHNFIDAYSGEGWKGQSAEKIKPEKELQRASSEILRCKRRIRELFQHLDASCAEGRFQESLFDSEGLISSEDIFCAKCRSKDLSADNDIILCDGICDRGFHQMCLEPPLLKEDIPPGDEGWLCPGCDCKLDCIDILDDSQGTNLSIDDVWEKVFPEAATKTTGDVIDDIYGLRSDDSDDVEYNPDASGVEGVHTKGSSSDHSDDSEGSDDSKDSDFSSASDDMGVRPVNDQNLVLPSDDSEDDEYDPNAPDLEQTEESSSSDFSSASDDMGVRPVSDQNAGLSSDDSEDDEYDPNAPDLEQTKEESSNSDFTSASEYFSVSGDANESSGAEDSQVPSSVDGSMLPGSSNGRSKITKNKKQSINSELHSILEPNSQGDPSPVLEKRQRERLDYKKLHDEAYGNVPSDSSDDEDWAEADAPEENDSGVGEESSLPPKAHLQTIASTRNTKYLQNRGSKKTENTSKRRGRPKKDLKGADSSVAETHADSSEPDFTEKKPTASAFKTLGQTVTQRLYESFKENKYPNQDTKENLAKESGIEVKQVTKWFDNARWSLRHQSNNAISGTTQVQRNKVQTPNKLVGPESTGNLPDNVDNSEVPEMSKAGSPKTLRNEGDVDVDVNIQTLENASANNRTRTNSPTEKQTPGKLAGTETKILPDDKESSEARTPNSSRNGKDGSVNLDHQTSNEALTNNRTLVISIPAFSPKAEQARRKGRKTNQVTSQSQIRTRSVAVRSKTQTRSKKAATQKEK